MKGTTMAGTKTGGSKARNTIYQIHGKDYFKRIGSMGGKECNPLKGFGSNRERAIDAGRKGGHISKRGKSTKMKIELSTEQVNQILHYEQTKSIATACNIAQSLVDNVIEKLAKELM